MKKLILLLSIFTLTACRGQKKGAKKSKTESC
jgi:predicted small lipoprotein YifL